MNGIDYGTLLGNTNFFTQSKEIGNQSKIKGQVTGTDKSKKTNADQDTVEINGKSRQIPQAGYQKPSQVTKKNSEDDSTKIKNLDANGVEEGIELSDAAKKLLEELKSKYSNMEFRVAQWSTDEEEDYYASKCQKDYSVLIDPQALEAMAADDDVRSQYESILDNAGQTSEKLKEELGDDADKVENFTISIDQDGKVSYSLKLIQDFNEKNTKSAKDLQKSLEEKRAQKKEEAKKKAKAEAVENAQSDSDQSMSIESTTSQSTVKWDESGRRVTANSLDDLIAAVKEKLQAA